MRPQCDAAFQHSICSSYIIFREDRLDVHDSRYIVCYVQQTVRMNGNNSGTSCHCSALSIVPGFLTAFWKMLWHAWYVCSMHLILKVSRRNPRFSNCNFLNSVWRHMLNDVKDDVIFLLIVQLLKLYLVVLWENYQFPMGWDLSMIVKAILCADFLRVA